MSNLVGLSRPDARRIVRKLIYNDSTLNQSDLPTASVREEIFAMHLTRRKLDPATFDLPAPAAASEGFSGAEIEQTIVSALYDAASKATPTDDAILRHALQQTRPLLVLMHEQVAALRAWAQDRCMAAD